MRCQINVKKTKKITATLPGGSRLLCIPQSTHTASSLFVLKMTGDKRKTTRKKYGRYKKTI